MRSPGRPRSPASCQLVWIIVVAHRAGLSLRLPRPRLTPDVRRLLKLMVPGAIGAGVSQINLLIGTIIATFIPGAVSFLYFADRVYQFPLGIIGVAIGTALLPDLSRKLERDPAAAMDVQNRAIEIALLFTLPAAATMLAIPDTLCTILFQYGAFKPQDAAATAGALAAFAAGLPGYVLIRVLTPGFFARHDTTRPVYYADHRRCRECRAQPGARLVARPCRHRARDRHRRLDQCPAARPGARPARPSGARPGDPPAPAAPGAGGRRHGRSAGAWRPASSISSWRAASCRASWCCSPSASWPWLVYFGLVLLLRAADTSDLQALLRRRRGAAKPSTAA